MVKDGLTAEKASANCAELKRVQAGDVSYEEAKAAAASRARLELDGVSAEKSQVQAKVSVTEKVPEEFVACHSQVDVRTHYRLFVLLARYK